MHESSERLKLVFFISSSNSDGNDLRPISIVYAFLLSSRMYYDHHANETASEKTAVLGSM